MLLRLVNQRPPSPCKRICKLEAGNILCTGCGRTTDEIVEWGSATAARQFEIAERASMRLEEVISVQAPET